MINYQNVLNIFEDLTSEQQELLYGFLKLKQSQQSQQFPFKWSDIRGISSKVLGEIRNKKNE